MYFVNKGEVNGLLLGDSGYACKKYLMTPYLHPQNGPQERYVKKITSKVWYFKTLTQLKTRSPDQLTYEKPLNPYHFINSYPIQLKVQMNRTLCDSLPKLIKQPWPDQQTRSQGQFM